MKNSLRIHKWTHNEFNIFILGVLTHPQTRCLPTVNALRYQRNRARLHDRSAILCGDMAFSCRLASVFLPILRFRQVLNSGKKSLRHGMP